VATVKMLNFFATCDNGRRHGSGVLPARSLFIENFWCRYLCPYGKLLGLARWPVLGNPARDGSCIDCGLSSRVSAKLRVRSIVTIVRRSVRRVLECVAVCPVEDTLRYRSQRSGASRMATCYCNCTSFFRRGGRRETDRALEFDYS